ncbi:hypothetical protein FOL47_002794 [Perkinsus chesapeaki]|uniref:Sfi1 spindle body domain-containing protein n=1 Tax=Perkinsus chesapeaki TaxID=330153 RepID=A0A7J6MC65_PERCH|nr:hypothetical protein FOL47_002794 [Perkinsus chesapeaki]
MASAIPSIDRITIRIHVHDDSPACEEYEALKKILSLWRSLAAMEARMTARSWRVERYNLELVTARHFKDWLKLARIIKWSRNDRLLKRCAWRPQLANACSRTVLKGVCLMEWKKRTQRVTETIDRLSGRAHLIARVIHPVVLPAWKQFAQHAYLIRARVDALHRQYTQHLLTEFFNSWAFEAFHLRVFILRIERRLLWEYSISWKSTASHRSARREALLEEWKERKVKHISDTFPACINIPLVARAEPSIVVRAVFYLLLSKTAARRQLRYSSALVVTVTGRRLISKGHALVAKMNSVRYAWRRWRYRLKSTRDLWESVQAAVIMKFTRNKLAMIAAAWLHQASMTKRLNVLADQHDNSFAIVSYLGFRAITEDDATLLDGLEYTSPSAVQVTGYGRFYIPNLSDRYSNNFRLLCVARRLTYFSAWYKAAKLTRTAQMAEYLLTPARIAPVFNAWRAHHRLQRPKRLLRCLFRLWRCFSRASTDLIHCAGRVEAMRQRNLLRRALWQWANRVVSFDHLTRTQADVLDICSLYMNNARRLTESITDRVQIDWYRLLNTMNSHSIDANSDGREGLRSSMHEWQRLSGMLREGELPRSYELECPSLFGSLRRTGEDLISHATETL